MLAIGIVILGVVVLLAVLMLTPITLYGDSDERQYHFKLKGFFKIGLKGENGLPIMLLEVPGMTKKVDVIKLITQKQAPPKKEETGPKRGKKAKRRKSRKSIIKFVTEVARTFEVKRLVLDIDLDDYMVNAQLCPILFWASGGNIVLSTNYQDRVYFHVLMQNRLVRLIPPLWRLIWSG